MREAQQTPSGQKADIILSRPVVSRPALTVSGREHDHTKKKTQKRPGTETGAVGLVFCHSVDYLFFDFLFLSYCKRLFSELSPEEHDLPRSACFCRI
jgi:hypothetical protein